MRPRVIVHLTWIKAAYDIQLCVATKLNKRDAQLRTVHPTKGDHDVMFCLHYFERAVQYMCSFKLN